MSTNTLGIQEIEISGHKVRVTLFLKTRLGKTFIAARASIHQTRPKYKELLEFYEKHKNVKS